MREPTGENHSSPSSSHARRAPAAGDWHAAVEYAIARLKDVPGALLPVLHAVQDAIGHIPFDSVPAIASGLNLSRAEVHGVISFYHDFRTEPPGRHVIHVCRAESCQAVGAERLVAHARARLGVELHGTTADGAMTLEPVYCLGNCALSPAVMVDRRLYGQVSPERLDLLIESLR